MIAATKRLFPPGALEIELKVDPDEPYDEYLVVTVEALGEFHDILKRQDKWHDEVESLVGQDAIKFRLSIYPR